MGFGLGKDNGVEVEFWGDRLALISQAIFLIAKNTMLRLDDVGGGLWSSRHCGREYWEEGLMVGESLSERGVC
jgi:hypothetical protein